MTFLSPFWTNQKLVKLAKTQLYFWTCHEQKIFFKNQILLEFNIRLNHDFKTRLFFWLLFCFDGINLKKPDANNLEKAISNKSYNLKKNTISVYSMSINCELFRYDSVHQKYKRLKRYVAHYKILWH